MKLFNLQYYINKLKKGEHFSLARYGDGELYCMWGKQGENSNGCRYSPELRKALIDSMYLHRDDPSFIYGMQRVLQKDRDRAEIEYPVDWHDSEFFGEAVAHGQLFSLIEQLRKMPLVVIGNESIKEFVTKELSGYEGINYFFDVQKSNAYDEREHVIKSCLKHKDEKRVYLFSCGMAANAFISKLHGQVDGWLIDVGHIWDPFVGNMSRCDLEGKTVEDIQKNLEPTT